MRGAEEVRRLEGHRGPVASLAWADCKTLVSADHVGTARFWDVTTGKEVRQLPVTAHAVQEGYYALVVSADGKTVATGWGITRIVDAATGKQLPELRTGYPTALSADGKTLAAWVPTAGAPLLLWDVAAGRELRWFVSEGEWGGDDRVSAATFSPDGKTLIGGCSDGAVRLWEVATGKERGQLRGHQGGITAVAVSADGKYLASGGRDRTLRLWHLPTGKELAQFQGHRGHIASVALSPDGKYLVSGGHDTTVLIWETAGRLPGEATLAADLLPRELEALWADLAGDDARKAHQAIGRLVAGHRQSAPFLQERLRPVAAVPPQQLARLIADLDSDEFAAREKATAALEKLGLLARSALEKALAGQPSPEVRRRAERLLERLDRPTLTADELRAWRALEVLEQVGTAEARRVLQGLAEGAPGAQQTEEARAAGLRLAKRQPLTP